MPTILRARFSCPMYDNVIAGCCKCILHVLLYIVQMNSEDQNMFLRNCKFRETASAADVRYFIGELCDGLCNLLMVLLSETGSDILSLEGLSCN